MPQFRKLTPGEVSIVLGETAARLTLPGLAFRACARVAAYLGLEVHCARCCLCQLRGSLDELARDLAKFAVPEQGKVDE